MSNDQIKNKSFDYRSFVSFGMLFSFIIMTLTGIVLYITPPGRVAKWVTWTFFGLEKDEWQAVHTIFSYLFLILSIFHIFFMNWKTIKLYIKKKTKKGINRKKELYASIVLTLIFFAGTIIKVPPFQSVMDLGEYFTESWEKKEEFAPMPHTEEMTISELSEKVISLSPEQIKMKFTDKGIVVDDNKTLKEIGKENNISPFDLYKIISVKEKNKLKSDGSFQPGRGIGRKTMNEIADMLMINVDRILLYLKETGIDVSGEDIFRDVAKKEKLTPRELMDKIYQIKNK